MNKYHWTRIVARFDSCFVLRRVPHRREDEAWLDANDNAGFDEMSDSDGFDSRDDSDKYPRISQWVDYIVTLPHSKKVHKILDILEGYM